MMNWKKKRVIVTGGAGFIGQNIVTKLSSEGADITVIDNFNISPKTNLSKFEDNIKIIKSNICEKNLIRELTGNFDYLFHFAGPSSVIQFNESPLEAFSSTTAGFINVLNIATKKNIKKVIYPSSGSVYGKNKGLSSEQVEPHPGNLYAVGKLSCEKIAKLYSEEVNNVGLRIFAGYGQGESHKKQISSPITLFLSSIIRDEQPILYGNGSQARDFVYIDDVIDVIIKCCEIDDLPEILNVGSGKSYTFNEVVSLINNYLKKDIKPYYIPKPSKYLEWTMADTSLLSKTLSVNPRPLETGIKDYLNALNINCK